MKKLGLEDRLAMAVEKWGLTRREVDVLRLLATEGASNAKLSAMLGIQENTVEQYLSNLLRKSGLGSRTEIVAWFWWAGNDSEMGDPGDGTECV